LFGGGGSVGLDGCVHGVLGWFGLDWGGFLLRELPASAH
jgi:hypothetical protein